MSEVSHYYTYGSADQNPQIQYRDTLSIIRVANSDITHYPAVNRITSFLDSIDITESQYSSAAILLADGQYFETLSKITDQEMFLHANGAYVPHLTYVQRNNSVETAMNPLFIVNASLSSKKLNKTILHELGHFVRDTEGKAQETRYNEKDYVAKVGRNAVAACIESAATFLPAVALDAAMKNSFPVLSEVSFAALTTSLLVARQPLYFAWLAEKEERACNQFAWKHRQTNVLVERD